MKLIVKGKWRDCENINYAIELPEEFSCYETEFLMDHFSNCIMDAIIDLRIPEHLPIAVQLNEDWRQLKVKLYKNLCDFPDKKMLGKIMSEVKLGFVGPENLNKRITENPE